MQKTPLAKRGKTPVSKLQKECDKLLQLVNKAMRKECEACGGSNQVGHHWIEKSRSNYLRYNMDNIIPLCNSCHVKIHNLFGSNVVGSLNVAEIIISKRGKKWKTEMDRLQPEYIKTDRQHYEGVKEKFESLLTEYLEL